MRRTAAFTRIASILCVFGLAPSFGVATAQTASLLTPEVLAPKPPDAPLDLKKPPAAEPEADIAGAASESTPMAASVVRLENAPPDEEAACRALIEKEIAATPLTLGAVARAGKAVQRRLEQRGYVLARVLVLTDGPTSDVVRIHVVDGYVERVDLDQLPEELRRRARTLLAPLERRSWLRAAKLHRQLELLNQVPGANVTAALVKGTEMGGAVLVVAGLSKTVQAWASVDNRYGRQLGETQQVIGAAISNLAERGDRTVLQASGNFRDGWSTPHPVYRALVADTSVGLGGDGLSAFASWVDVLSEPHTPRGALPVGSRFERISAGLRYPFALTQAGSLTGAIQIEAARDQTYVAPYTTVGLSLDRTRVVRLALDGRLPRMGSAGAATMTLRHSVGLDGLGARAARDATSLLPLSRQRATAAFSKTELDLETATPLGPNGRWRLTTHLSAQTSYREAMLRSEQASFAAPDLLSAFDSGAVTGDSGAAVRSEVTRPARVWRTELAPYIFAGAGLAEVHAPTSLERRTTRATNYGLGLRAQIPLGQAAMLDVRTEYGVGWKTDAKTKPHTGFTISIIR